jgi:hypothetical protein
MPILGSGPLAWLGGSVDANTVIAICGVVIAVASLAVSAYVAWATRKHNRLSVRPLLGLTTTFPAGAAAGLRLTNSGLGPAKIISSQLTVSGEAFGEFDQPNVDKLRRRLDIRPHAATLGGQPFLDTDYQQFLLSIDPYDPSGHAEFRQLIEEKLRLEIRYESVYGGEGFTVVYPRRGTIPSRPAGPADHDQLT